MGQSLRRIRIASDHSCIHSIFSSIFRHPFPAGSKGFAMTLLSESRNDSSEGSPRLYLTAMNCDNKLETKLFLMFTHIFLCCVTKAVAVFFILWYRKSYHSFDFLVVV
jgi:hypothetical protein